MKPDTEKVLSILAAHENNAANLIAILQDVQAEYNYLSEANLTLIADALDISVSRVYSVATFYENFSLEAKGKHIIKVCAGTACHVRKSIPILERLRKEPQYIDSVFTAKANRTKMEEEPVLAVPTTEVKNDFIISQDTEKQESEEKHVNVFKEEVYTEDSSAEDVVASTVTEEITTTATQESEDEFDLSDISAEPKEMSREDIIAAAEAAAFAEDKE